MVASSVVVPVVPPVTRLPGDTRRSPMRPGYGRAQLGELEIEGRLPHGGLLGRHVGLRDALGLRALLEGLLADDIAADQALGARQVGLGIGQIGLACARLARAWSSAFWNGRRSMVNRQVALLDHWPSWKWMESR